MKEDIKILEEWLIQLNELFEKTKINNTKERKSLENLIKGYRELEEQIDKHVYFETTNPKEIEKNFIPKSKIKEKIEEYKQITDKYDKQMENDEETDLSYEEVREYACRLQALQELMEDK